MTFIKPMSRVGKSIIQLNDGVTVTVENGGRFGYKEVTVKGPKGELKESIRHGVDIVVENNTVTLTRDNDAKQTKAYHGLYRSLIANMVKGVAEGFSRELEIVGIGYRAELQGQNVVFSLGYSHKITLTPPAGIIITVDDQTKVKVEGVDKQKVGEVAAKIRSFRAPEPYKGKGVRYSDEVVKRKSTKSA